MKFMGILVVALGELFLLVEMTSSMLTYYSHTLVPPRGYTVAGLSGSCGQWLDGLSLIITR